MSKRLFLLQFYLGVGLLAFALGPTPTEAQFNGTNGIFALNHMQFGVMADNLTVATPGTGYVAGNTVTLDCPNTTTFNYTGGVYPVVTYNGTVWTLTNPGLAGSIPSTGLAGGNNGTCLLTQLSTSGSGSGITFNATFGFNAASLNGSNSSGGGGGGLTGLTIYPTHAALIAGVVIAPSGPNTLLQQGFSSAGGQGQAVYEWNSSSYCPSGTNITPVAADGIVCILPSTQSANAAGRYLIQVGPSIDVTQFGFAANGQDNSPYIAGLMLAMGAPNDLSGGYDVIFPPVPGQQFTSYYFSQSLTLSRGAHYYCGGGLTKNNSIALVFAAGVHGVLQEGAAYTADGGAGGGMVEGCGIYSQGHALSAAASAGSATITGAGLFNADFSGLAPASIWHNGDGVVVWPQQSAFSPIQAAPAVSPGTFVSTVTGGTTLTLNNTVNSQLAAAQAAFSQTANTNNNFIAGDVLVLGNSTYTFVSSIGSTPGNVLVGTSFLVSAQNLANCINNNTTTSSCVAQSTTPNITMDSPPFNRFLRFWATVIGTAGNSLTSTYTPAGTSAGSFGAATFGSGFNSAFAYILNLPVSQSFTVQTTSGSPIVLVTGSASGRFLAPGEVIWNKAFPFGTSIVSVQGAALFTQTSSNNFVAGDSISVNYQGRINTYNFVTPIGSAPGNVLIGANFAASANNLIAAVNRGAGSGTVYIAPSASQNTFGCGPAGSCTYGLASSSTFEILGTATGPFNGTNGLVSYTPVGVAAGSFDHSGMIDQNLVMSTAFLEAGTTQNATETDVNGTMWALPVGLKRDVTAQSRRLSFSNWAIGLEMPCESNFLNSLNCTFSADEDNLYEENIVAVWHSGNNYSGSQSIGESGAKNYLADFAELGPLGVSYFNANSHSGESGTSTYNVLANCTSLNASYFQGGYFGGSSYPMCANPVGLTPATIGGPLVITPLNTIPTGANYILNGQIGGSWKEFSGPNFLNCLVFGSPQNATYIFGFDKGGCQNTATIWNLYNSTVVGGNTWDLSLGVGSPIPVLRFYNNSGVTSLSAPNGMVSTGAHPTLTTGSCHGSGAVGGIDGGTFVAPVCSGGTVILSALPTMPNGWVCTAQDLTTPADALTPASSTATTYTFNPVTTVASDVIQFGCKGF